MMEELTPECIIFCQIILKLNIDTFYWTAGDKHNMVKSKGVYSQN